MMRGGKCPKCGADIVYAYNTSGARLLLEMNPVNRGDGGYLLTSADDGGMPTARYTSQAGKAPLYHPHECPRFTARRP